MDSQRATLHSLTALGKLLECLRLFGNVIAAVLGIPGEVIRGKRVAKVAVEAGVFDVESPASIAWVSFAEVCHNRSFYG